VPYLIQFPNRRPIFCALTTEAAAHYHGNGRHFCLLYCLSSSKRNTTVWTALYEVRHSYCRLSLRRNNKIVYWLWQLCANKFFANTTPTKRNISSKPLNPFKYMNKQQGRFMVGEATLLTRETHDVLWHVERELNISRSTQQRLWRKKKQLFWGNVSTTYGTKAYYRPDDGGSVHLWNVGLLQQNYTALCPRRLSFPYSPPW
jgi:hypothetical protein